ncbi:MAG: S8 family serine peptidase [Planctomycetes bacterium]|nr:S8 family serine peptidase [Planctomycetota bacterium]
MSTFGDVHCPGSFARSLLLALAAIPVGVLGCGDDGADGALPQDAIAEPPDETVLLDADGPGVVEGEILVKFRRGVGRDRQRAALERVGRHIHHFSDRNAGPRGRRGPELFDRLTQVVLKDDVDGRKAADELASHPDVEYVEPNFIVRALDVMPDDPSFYQLWGLHNTGQTAGTVDADIDAPAAWELGTGSAQVVVGVVDTGIDYTHPDLAANMWLNSDEIPGNGVDDDGNGRVDDRYGYDFANNDGNPMDDHYHGTHVAGTIGAVGNNGVGVSGVCWTVRLMALKFLGASGSGSLSGAVSAIQYAIANGAHVLSNSWGGGGYSQALRDAIAAAHNAGIVFVAAAGNRNTDAMFYPAGYPNVIAVAATNHNDAKAFFSNYGFHIDVAAPGVSVYSTKPSNQYGALSGTSMACPHVSGLAALLKSRNAMLTPDQIEGIIKASADDRGDPGWDPIYGTGRINAHTAMQMVAQGQINLPTASITSPSQGQTLSQANVNIVGTAAGSGFAGYVVEYSGSGVPWTVLTSSNTPVTNGVLAVLPAVALADGGYLLRLNVTTLSGRHVYATVAVTVDQIIAELTLPGSVASQGNPWLTITGSAYVNAGTFDHFALHYGEGFAPTSWNTDRFTVAGGGALPIVTGTLGTFDLTGLEGFYVIRLTVFSAVGSNSRTHLLCVDPYLRPGWPVLMSTAMSSPAVGDVNGANAREVLIPTSAGLRAYDKDAGFLFAHATQNSAGSPAPIQASTCPTLTELATAPGLEFAFFDTYVHRLYAANQGMVLPGFYVPLAHDNVFKWKSNSVMACDLNGDGNDDLILPTVDAGAALAYVHARSRNGTSLPGFPFTYSYSLPQLLRAGAVADVDGDGLPEIFFSVVQKQQQNSLQTIVKATLFGVSHLGSLLPGFPIDFTGFSGGNANVVLSDIAIADINATGQKEIVF